MLRRALRHGGYLMAVDDSTALRVRSMSWNATSLSFTRSVLRGGGRRNVGNNGSMKELKKANLVYTSRRNKDNTPGRHVVLVRGVGLRFGHNLQTLN